MTPKVCPSGTFNVSAILCSDDNQLQIIANGLQLYSRIKHFSQLMMRFLSEVIHSFHHNGHFTLTIIAKFTHYGHCLTDLWAWVTQYKEFLTCLPVGSFGVGAPYKLAFVNLLQS